jgi:hypothetical protein
MAETAINITVGGILSGIAFIGASVEQYQLQDENILNLHREIQLIEPFIQNLKISPPQIGIYARLQNLAILLQKIKMWITGIGQMSKFKHFIFAISHKKQILQFYLEIKEIKMELGFELKVGNYQSQTKLNQQIDELLHSLVHSEENEKIKLLFETQKELYDSKLYSYKEFIQEIDDKFNGLIQEHEFEIEKLKLELIQLNKRMENVEKILKENPFENSLLEFQQIQLENQRIQMEIIKSNNYRYELEIMSKEKRIPSVDSEMIEYQKIQLENQKIQLEILKSNNYKLEMELDANKSIKPTCECESESQDYPYCVVFCSAGCRGKNINIDQENQEYYKSKLKEIVESIPQEKQKEYEEFITYVESRDHITAEHIVYILEYEMKRKEKMEKINEIQTKELEIVQSRHHYNQVYTIYHNHLVQCVGEKNSHGSTSQYRNENWYGEHCRLWQIQSTAQSKVYQLEKELEEIKNK